LWIDFIPVVRLAQIVERRNHLCHCLKECLYVIGVVLSVTPDLNAAINLKQEAVRLTVLACGLDSADTSRSSVSLVELVKQEEKAGSC
jgi:hypothetical protein